MITKTYINGDLTALKTVLESTELFDSVTLDDDNTPTAITCKDAAENTLGVIKNTEITVYASENDSVTRSYGSNFNAIYAYSYKDNVIIKYSAGSSYAYVMISNTNKNTVAFAFSYSAAAESVCMSQSYCIAWGDSAPLAYVNYSMKASTMQTGLMVLPTNSADTHTVNAFFMPYGDYSSNEREFTMNEKTYFTNSY